jgi:hypothetical protein
MIISVRILNLMVNEGYETYILSLQNKIPILHV